MKKLLGISLIAILTTGPAFADVPDVTTQQPAIGGGDADVATTDPTWKMVAATEADASTVATTSYVKGAYNAGLKATNKIHERVGNLSNLDESLVEKNDGGEIISDITDAINAVNTKAVSKLSASDITEGDTPGAIKVGGNTVNVNGLGGAAFTGVEDIVNNVKTGLAMPDDVAENGYAINAKSLKVLNKDVLTADSIDEGEVDGTIKVGTTNVAVKNAVNTTKLGAGEAGYDINAKTLQVQGDPVLTKDGIQGMTGKTIDATQNTISGLNKSNFAENVVVATIAGEDASVDKIASEKAVRDAINGLSGTYATAEQGTKADNAADKSFSNINDAARAVITEKVVANAANGTFTAGDGFTEGVNTIAEGLNDLNARVGNSVVESRLETTAENATDGYDINARTLKVGGEAVATQTGVESTINNLTYTSTVNGIAVWGSDETVPISVTTNASTAVYPTE